MRADEIIQMARELKKVYKTDDPFEIADIFGYKVQVSESAIKDSKARIMKIDGYPVLIWINSKFTKLSQKVLCAHELGHAFLHADSVNHFDITTKNATTNVEYEANLFAVAFLCDDDQFNMSLNKMNNALLKAVLDCNITEKV